MFRIVKKLLMLWSVCFAVYWVYVAPVFMEYGGGNCLLDGRKQGAHTDFLFGFRWIKWKQTVVCGVAPPVQDFGSQDYFTIGTDNTKSPKPIPPGGRWQLSHATVKTRLWTVRLPYFAVTSPGHYHFRLGWRWDDNDNFYTFSIAMKKIPYDWERLLYYWSRHEC